MWTIPSSVLFTGGGGGEPFSVVRALFTSSWIVEEGILFPKKEGLLNLQYLFFGTPLPFARQTFKKKQLHKKETMVARPPNLKVF